METRIIPDALQLARLQRTNQTESQILESYKRDAELILNYIRPKKMLDIGCGIAGVETFIPGAEFFLIDKSQTDEDLYYGYHEKTSFYSSLEIAERQIRSNQPDAKIHTHEADNTIPFKEKFDLIISFISCGFHYPVTTYLDEIYEKLEYSGLLIIDIRNGTDQETELKKRFKRSQILQETKTYRRWLFEK